MGFVGRPVFMAFTRWRERAADAFGARHTSREAMARALVRLADQNLADPEPPRWEELFFYSHPAIANRVRALGLRWEDFGGTVPAPSPAPLSR
jgi:STE24 endopeptidase